MSPNVALAAAIVVGTSALAVPAFAIEDDPGIPVCEAGQVYDQKKKVCVPAQSDLIEDDSLARYAYALAKRERFEEALATLDLMRNPDTAEALNYRGYATRKLGRVDEGIGYYRQAIALDPEYVLVREYLGEAYVSQGRLDLARAELLEIENRCGTTCEPYYVLAEMIEGVGANRDGN